MNAIAGSSCGISNKGESMRKVVNRLYNTPVLFAVVLVLGFILTSELTYRLMRPIENDVVYFILRCTTEILLATALALWLKRKIGRGFVIGFTWRRLGKAFFLLIACYIGLASNFLNMFGAFANVDPSASASQILGAVTSGFFSGLRPGVVEELVCRVCVMGYLMYVWAKKPNRIFSAVFLSSLIFGLAHLNNLQDQALPEVLTQCVYSTAIGMLYGAVYARTRNIVAPMVIHSLTDISVFIQNDLPVMTGGLAPVGEVVANADIASLIVPILFAALWFGAAMFLMRKKKRHEVEALWKVEEPVVE